ncbi:hypothetical protein LCM4577_31375 [Mesorhizobium sp. LCM 4577]|uniref:DUF3606 domain-containing protein n=2 Tax=Mesorhizobium TaxID=68287 RepID=A0A090GVK2_MESPL|nr:hypothetical protein LCM4577_31375 [Mesorhizobium sp. LCM 4577]CDX12511.1 conserved hypothetical protein [Mesorhizobium plurifarium]CDX39454.1 conserved hypothetical protein [Mesorhizobium plurifarium]CDX60350.1 conserved hypothetical protein [Mesorhizobium plurifarium]
MTRDRMSKDIENWADAYDVVTFARKYGLTVQQAKVIISSNGPSRHGCDMGAIAFVRAMRLRASRPSRTRKKLTSPAQ